MTPQFTDMVKVLPVGAKGEAEVRHYQISEREAARSRTREVITAGRERAAKVGAYAQLFVDGSLVMSDTQMERDSNRGLVLFAQGDLLIAGLGLGMVLLPLLSKREVKSVTVVELSKDVINLVEPHIRRATGKLAAEKLAVIQADIFEWKPPKGQKWDYIYFDIWPNLCTTNLKEMTRLNRKFCRRKNPGATMDSWGHIELLRMQRQGW